MRRPRHVLTEGRHIDIMPTRPVTIEELPALFAGLEGYDVLLVAVSGGADSMALLALVHRWFAAARPAGSRLVVATVDHGLRPESAEEARFVAAAAHRLHLEHRTLGWSGPKPETGIQAAARDARRHLLLECARSAGGARTAVLVAHTQDDQAETLLMRLARGSGLDGLAAMRRVQPLLGDPAVSLVRPLLGLPKARLVATLQESALAWIEDPSNENETFERVRLRRARALLASMGLENEALALSAQRLLRARGALEAAAGELFHAAVDTHGGLFASWERAVVAQEPEELRLRLLAQVLAAFGGASRPARLAQVEGLLAMLDSGRTHATTLGGCVVSAGSRLVRVYREPGRAPLPSVELVPGASVTWDSRFQVSLSGAMGGGLTVRALGEAAAATLARLARPRPGPLRAVAGLPAFWRGDELVAVPSLGFGAQGPGKKGEVGHAVCNARFLGLEKIWGGTRTAAENEESPA